MYEEAFADFNRKYYMVKVIIIGVYDGGPAA